MIDPQCKITEAKPPRSKTYVREHCRELRRDGLTLPEIARQTGLTWAQVQRRCDGIPAPSRRSKIVDQILRLYREGLEPEQIAERLGCKLSRVYAYMPKRYGVSPETKRMRELRRQGWTYREIALEMNTSIGRVEWRVADVLLSTSPTPQRSNS